MVGILVLIASMALPAIKTMAEESNIKSRGNIEGIINFYSDDIRYLEEEIDKLLAECMED